MGSTLPFLDVLMQREEDGAISTTVYRKSTHTDCYLDFASRHPIVHKAAVVRTLFSRAATVSSCAVSLRDEHAYIKRTLGANHYPVAFVRSHSRSYSGPRQNTSPPRRSVVIPYVRGLSEGIKHILPSADVSLGLLVLCIVAGRDLALPDSMRDTVAGRTPFSGFGRGP